MIWSMDFIIVEKTTVQSRVNACARASLFLTRTDLCSDESENLLNEFVIDDD